MLSQTQNNPLLSPSLFLSLNLSIYLSSSSPSSSIPPTQTLLISLSFLSPRSPVFKNDTQDSQFLRSSPLPGESSALLFLLLLIRVSFRDQWLIQVCRSTDGYQICTARLSPPAFTAAPLRLQTLVALCWNTRRVNESCDHLLPPCERGTPMYDLQNMMVDVPKESGSCVVCVWQGRHFCIETRVGEIHYQVSLAWMAAAHELLLL